jgi:hypothetical protein
MREIERQHERDSMREIERERDRERDHERVVRVGGREIDNERTSRKKFPLLPKRVDRMLQDTFLQQYSPNSPWHR